jgi:hypothetical protein
MFVANTNLETQLYNKEQGLEAKHMEGNRLAQLHQASYDIQEEVAHSLLTMKLQESWNN